MGAKRGLLISPKDNVANVLEDVASGEEIAVRGGEGTVVVRALERIPFGFKVAMADIRRGEPVYKYGEAIGKASQAIRRGELVHIHNLEGARGRGDLNRGG